MNQFRARLTYANVMSTIAVFLALGGAAVAATKLPKNSVGPGQLKKNAVRTTKIKNGSVTSAKLRNEAVSEAKIGGGAVSSSKLADGAVISVKLADGSVLSGKIADGAITGAKLAGGAVGSGKLADGAVTASKISNGAATAGKLAESPYKLFTGISALPAPGAVNGISSHEVECPAGTRMLSGGLLNEDPELRLLATHPNNEDSWRVTVLNESPAPIDYAMVLTCLQ